MHKHIICFCKFLLVPSPGLCLICKSQRMEGPGSRPTACRARGLALALGLASSACVIVTHGVLDQSGKSTKTAHRRCNKAMSKCISSEIYNIDLFVHGHSRTHGRHAPTGTAIGESNTKRRDLTPISLGIQGQSLIFSRS